MMCCVVNIRKIVIFGVLYWIDNNKTGKPYNFEYH